MLHLVDSNQASRREWLGLLARAPLEMLEASAAKLALPFTWLRRPETGLVMVRARAGGSGAKFNLGEMTVTRCALRLKDGASGVAYVQGRSHRKAELAALADARLQSGCASALGLVEGIRAHLAREALRMQRKAQATRVEFFTLAREAGE
jgi:alpha-D-ribose 1-methylphosphonate 5-triphosphate synthase subunit PhnG